MGRSKEERIQGYFNWPMQGTVAASVEQPVVSGSETEGTRDTVDLMDNYSGYSQDVSSDSQIGCSGQEKRSYSAVIIPSGSVCLQSLRSSDQDEESGKWVNKNVRKHVIKGTALVVKSVSYV